MSIAAVLFDMDGVLIDTHHSVTVFWQDLAERHRVALSDAIFAEHIYGTPATYTLSMLFPRLTALERQGVLDNLARYEAGLAYTEIKGVISLVRALRQYEIATALVTSAQPHKVRNALVQLGVRGLFSATITAEDVTHGKPDPQCYLLAAQRLDKAPEQCLVFEDAVSGVKAATAARMLCIGIQTESGASALLQVGAHDVVSDFSHVSLEFSPALDGSGSQALRMCLSSGPSFPLNRTPST